MSYEQKLGLISLLPALLASASPASAHIVWIERSAPDAVQVYFGEPDDHEKTGEVLDHLVPTLTTGNDHALPIERKPDHILAHVRSEASDVRLVDERYPPFGEGARGVMRPIMYARSGRTETRAAMAFELVPMETGSNRFTLLLDGKALPGHKVIATAPGGVTSEVVTDASGVVTLPSPASGQHILKASVIDRTPGSYAGKPFDMTARVTTLTFIQK